MAICKAVMPSGGGRRGGGGGGKGGGQLPPGAGTRGAPAKANKKKARPTKQRENNDFIQV